VASGPADTGNLPGNNGNELQGLALELRNTAQIDPAAQTEPSAFLFSILKNENPPHVQMEGGALPKGVPTTGLAADTMPVIV
jgi:hypothetical protein